MMTQPGRYFNRQKTNGMKLKCDEKTQGTEDEAKN